MTSDLHQTVRSPTDGSTPACDWATNLAIDAVAIAHGVTHDTAINSIADMLRAVRVAGQRDGIDAVLDTFLKREADHARSGAKDT